VIKDFGSKNYPGLKRPLPSLLRGEPMPIVACASRDIAFESDSSTGRQMVFPDAPERWNECWSGHSLENQFRVTKFIQVSNSFQNYSQQ
jgi:hypothetical protein